MRILAIDPGKKHIGAALFEFDSHIVWKLVQVNLQRFDSFELLVLRSFVADVVVVEVPQVYVASKSRGDPNDLIEIALVAGACLACAPMSVVVRPRAWKGTMNGDAMTARILRDAGDDDRAKLEQIKPASLRHNAIDAYGLGKWFLENWRRATKEIDNET